ncbi:hypothetical protein GCM10016234_40030 [Tianweitania populi]|uniref:Uncharacterized protein n=1 Tax=Tianweitania populi TaxID=1607949 RepID=A0A8J3GMG1_9HYPH|nr:hypothetical protein GCM10016234_40030 [Tianweitania populi]
MDAAFVETGMKTGVAIVGVIPEAWRLVANDPPDFQTTYARAQTPEWNRTHNPSTVMKPGLPPEVRTLTPRHSSQANSRSEITLRLWRTIPRRRSATAHPARVSDGISL